MISKNNFQVKEFSRKYNYKLFTCGNAALDDYINKYASQDKKRRIALTFVLTEPDNATVTGYYTISAASFAKENLPIEIAQKLPHYPVPSAIIGKLAVDTRFQAKGLGGFLLIDALCRILKAGEFMAVYAVIVDAIDDNAKSFYKKYGFIPFPEMPSRLFLPVKTIEQLIL